MMRQYNDLYALFRHDRCAEQYFNGLPGYVQEQIMARYKTVDTLQRLQGYADDLMRSFP